MRDSVQKNLLWIEAVRDNQRVIVSSTFYRKFNCYLNCGGCCPAHSLDYLPSEVETLKALYPAIEIVSRTVSYQGRSYALHSIPQSKAQLYRGHLYCSFLELSSGKCTIHDFNSLSCQLPLIKIVSKQGIGYIHKTLFSRGWNMSRPDGGKGAICDMSEFSTEQFYNNDIPALERLQQWAVYFQVHTKLSAVIEGLIQRVEAGKLEGFEV